jgi:hypothetical protein
MLKILLTLALFITFVSSSSFTSIQKKDILKAHNIERLKAKKPAVVGKMPKLTWSAPLEKIALKYAKLCTFQHNANRGSTVGENIFASVGPFVATTPVTSVNSWISEKSKYTYKKVTLENFAPTGHYTQVIWQTTTKVGCAYQNCNKNTPFSGYGPNWVIVVCDYSTSGNKINSYPYEAKGYTTVLEREEEEGLNWETTLSSSCRYNTEEALDKLNNANIRTSSSGRCNNRNNKKCTGLDTIRCNTLDGIIGFKQASGCNVVITGGTEKGHASSTMSHWNGYKVDISLSSCVTNYITSKYKRSGTRSDGSPLYKNKNGDIFAKEGNHWDITFL